MENIYQTQNTLAIIKKYNFIFQKRFGQNFLIDSHVLNKIINAAEINSNDCIIEIGPGIGSMTELLAKKAKKVIAIEIDKSLIPILQENLQDFNNILIINDDILKINIIDLIDKYLKNENIKLVANLPYYITTPIVMKLLEEHIPLQNITIMVQKEVAARMTAKENTKEYGALSLAIGYYSIPELIANVPSNCFIPRPKIDSSVIKLELGRNLEIKPIDEKFLFKIIKAAFMQRRKTLQNSISNFSDLNISKEQIAKALNILNLSLNIRGECLSLENFIKLSNLLK